MAPLPPSNDRKLSSTLKLYNSTNEPLQLDLAATSSFSLAFGPAITEAFSTSSATISTALSAKQVEFSINGITFRVDSPNSCTKGWISLDREPTTSRLLPPIERRTREDEKSVVKVLRFLVYQLNDVRTSSRASLKPHAMLTTVELCRYECKRPRSRMQRIPSSSSSSLRFR